MNVYGSIEKVEQLDDGTMRVHGIASSESLDDQGEIVRAAAMRDAIPQYMKFPALRTMHQLDAAGTTLQADVGDDGTTRVIAHVVDPVAVLKVKNNVFRAFSIGGRVTQREPGNPKVITGIVWNELSLVDRPANPDAVFNVWKAGAMSEPQAEQAAFNPPIQIWDCGNANHKHIVKSDAVKCQEKRAAAGADEMQAEVDAALKAVESGELIEAPSTPDEVAASATSDNPVVAAPEVATVAADEQIITDDLLAAARKAVETAQELLAKNGDDVEDTEKADNSKPYGDVPYADPGHKADGKKRYPIDTAAHVRAAWSYINMPKNHTGYTAEQVASIKSKIRAAGKKFDIEFSDDSGKASLGKSLWDIGAMAEVVAWLMGYCDRLEMERAMEGDDSSLPTKAQSVLSAAAELLRDSVAEETEEAVNGTEIDEPVTAMQPMMMAAIVDSLQKTLDPQRAEALVNKLEKAGARHDAPHQAQLDTAAYALGKAVGLNRSSRSSIGKMVLARKAVLDAGATDLNADGREMLTDGSPTQGAGEATQHSTVDTARNAQTSAPNPTGASPVAGYPPSPMGKTSNLLATIEAVIKAGGDARTVVDEALKAGSGHEALCNCAHDLMHAVSGGATCKAGTPKPGYLSSRDMNSLHEAHSHLMDVDGIQCASNSVPGGAPEAAGEAEGEGATSTAKGQKTAAVDDGDLAKTLADERAEKATLLKALGDIVPLMAGLSKRVDDIYNQPMPPALIRSGSTSLSKQQDGGSPGNGQLSPDDIAAALAKMSKEDQTLMLIKASYANPTKFNAAGRPISS